MQMFKYFYGPRDNNLNDNQVHYKNRSIKAAGFIPMFVPNPNNKRESVDKAITMEMTADVHGWNYHGMDVYICLVTSDGDYVDLLIKMNGYEWVKSIGLFCNDDNVKEDSRLKKVIHYAYCLWSSDNHYD